MKITLRWVIESNDKWRADALVKIEIDTPITPFCGLELEMPSPPRWEDPIWLQVEDVCYSTIENRTECSVKPVIDTEYGDVAEVSRCLDELEELGWRVTHRSQSLKTVPR